MNLQSKKRPLTAAETCLVLLCFLICLAGALLIPVDECPDEAGRRMLSDWMFRTGTLPTGDEMATILMSWEDTGAEVLTLLPERGLDGWGFSYALRPFLSSMAAALFMKAAALFTSSSRALIAASRMCSVLSVTACCYFCLRLGHKLFERRSSAFLFATLVCFLPQVMFLGMYQNNDALSLCAVSMMLYFFADGFGRKWPARSCAGLGASFSLGLLSYYSVYGWLLLCAVFCVAAVLFDPEISGKGRLILRRAALIAGICLLLAGWFFIRNAILHGGDFLGIASEEASREKMKALGYKLFDYLRYRDLGVSVWFFLTMADYYWLRVTAWSFVGMFGYMSILLPMALYNIYYALMSGGILLYIGTLFRRRPDRRGKYTVLLMLCGTAATFVLHFWQSFARDLQPQGRYVITGILLIGCLIAYGFDRIPLPRGKEEAGKAKFPPPAYLLAGLWILLFAWTAGGFMTKMLP